MRGAPSEIRTLLLQTASQIGSDAPKYWALTDENLYKKGPDASQCNIKP